VEEFPPEPKITFKSFLTYADSARLTIGFTDGDGDVGLDEADTLPPYNIEGDYYFNLRCDYYEKREGEWVLAPEIVIPFYYRVPKVTPTGQNPALNGEMSVIMTPLYYLPGTGYDTCRFEVTMLDRSLNVSNKIVTSSFIKPS
jgi:hypothetical protein